MKFRLWALRYTLRTSRPLLCPEGGEGNLLRGRFGAALHRLNPRAYDRLFRPHHLQGPSGMADAPRPFAFRDIDLRGDTIAFRFHLFDLREAWTETLRGVFEDMLHAEIVCVTGDDAPLEIPLTPNGPASAVQVQFLTPTELKTEGRVADRPEFGVLAARARDRVSALSTLYGDGVLEMDYRGFGERAEHVGMTRCEVRHVEASRKSKATGQTHSLGGIVGHAEYRGDLGEFLPILRAAEWTGIGRQTTWGKGVIAVSESPR